MPVAAKQRFAATAAAEPPNLPHWDHIVVVVEENKDYEQIIGNKDAPYLNQLAADDELGRKLQDAALGTRARAPRRKSHPVTDTAEKE